jgi:hypothetical protein
MKDTRLKLLRSEYLAFVEQRIWSGRVLTVDLFSSTLQNLSVGSQNVAPLLSDIEAQNPIHC